MKTHHLQTMTVMQMFSASAMFSYNLAMFERSSSPSHILLWSRFAAFLSFVAVLSALLAPVSMLAQDVQSGKLGGVCSLGNLVASSITDTAAADGRSVQVKAAHCDLCGASGVVPPLLALLVIPTFAGGDVAAFTLPAALAASIPGLPPSRGPPAV